MLDDVLVLDLTDLKGQFAGRVLNDLGMRVVKVEPPGGDPCRRMPPFKDDVPGDESSLRFAFLNGGKESITLDIARPEGRELLLDLSRHADVVLESFPPGYLASLDLGYDVLSDRNPSIVVASVTGFGQYGPHKDYLAPDIVAVAMGGLMYISGDPALPPTKPPETQAFFYGSLFAVYGVLLALFARETTGEGRHVDCSIQESIATQEHTIREAATSGEAIVRHGSQHRSVAPASVFACKDGYVFLFVLGARHWEALLELWTDHPSVLDAPELVDISRRRALAPTLNPLVEEFTRRFERRELTQLLQERGIPCLPVNTPREFLDEEQTRQRQLVGVVSSGALGDYLAPRFPALFDGQRPAPSGGPPRRGEHNERVYGQLLGLAPDALESLSVRRVI
jgi:crotonobetainyl-CoA:carnitine CoA-transferase CaiB-like acyl-CoA transferase